MMSARSSSVLFVSGNDPLDQRMADNVAFGEFDNSDAFRVSQNAMGLQQAGLFMRWQIDLRFVSRDDGLGIDAQPGQKHEHLFHGGVLRFVQDDKGMVES